MEPTKEPAPAAAAPAAAEPPAAPVAAPEAAVAVAPVEAAPAVVAAEAPAVTPQAAEPVAAEPVIAPPAAATEAAPSIVPAAEVASVTPPPAAPAAEAAPSIPTPEVVPEPAPALRLVPPPAAAVEAPSRVRTAARAGRFGLLAASVALAACLGAAGGAATVSGLARWTAPEPAKAAPPPQRTETAQSAQEVKALRETVTQMRGSLRALADAVTALRGSADTGNKGTQAQFAKLNEAIERLERTQAEPHARLAKLSEAVERLERRAAPAQHTAQAPAPETTGSVRPPALPPLNPDAKAGKPVIEGWTLRSVYEGVALVQNKQYGSFEVEVGDEILGAGTVQHIRRQDGKWVVVTSRGLIMPTAPVR